MISVPLSEGVVLDMLAIQEVKLKYGLVTKEEFTEFSGHVRKALGYGAYSIIVTSPEYAECVRVNDVVFQRVDDAKEDKVKASVVHNLNFERYKAKVALQKRFFPGSDISEKKN